ncbi:T9SS type A sorting domain-containing protein [Mangrovimonas sp. YM274]|uniref:T9SS type A sorting domain-containing protein n=1 Tax=Mangrovimonas sp. YM274 TaxID=3070660 RepID=UPI0027DBF6DA|nr:T9SS type A sorting domain-containing protein [Mangrovimonas sp. YM274]WMI68400.1 T9SS type A sorting domain-containing protein [Mangrovimonas sp. YM274]
MKLNYFSLFSFLTIPFLFYGQTPGGESDITSINSSITYQGFDETSAHAGTGEYKIYYDNIDGVFDKPIIITDGFDPNDSRTIDLMYSLLDYGEPVQNLADALRDEGFDIVVLNFPTYTSSTDNSTEINGGADFIQRNAFTLTELIETLNALKEGNEQNVVIGPSMGGLVAQYALRYMEQNSMEHDTRLFISFDTPHLGANVPMGIQYMFNYMYNGDPAIAEAENLVNGFLNSAAAKQMLIDHYLGHLQSGSDVDQDPTITLPVGAPNFRDVFQTEINTMGMPQDSRNVAIVNGSGTGEMTGTPGMELINHAFDTGVVGTSQTQATIAINFAPLASQTITVADLVGQINIFNNWIDVYNFEATAESPATSDGLDSAPGGQFDLYSFGDESVDLISEFVDNLNSQYFCFIPTLSALSISDSNWYIAPTTSSSPFDNTYIPAGNEPHVTLTSGNVAFALAEILENSLSLSSLEMDVVKLSQNPIKDQMSILSSSEIATAEIAIYDLTGKQVYQTKTSLTEHNTFNLKLDSGLYLLQVKDNSKILLNTKLVVN